MKHPSPRTVMTQHVREMEDLAAKGLCRRAIARETGWSYATVKRYVGHKVPPRPQEQRRKLPDINRYRQMLKAASAADIGMRNDIARRFGLKNAKVLGVVLVTARRRVAEAEGRQS